MATFSVVLLSGSTSGRPIKVAATATPGTTIHTAVSGTTSWDEVYLFAANTDTSAVSLTIEWGGTTDPDDLHPKTYSIPPNSAVIPIAFGARVNGAVVIKAFASSANKVTITGRVNRIVT